MEERERIGLMFFTVDAIPSIAEASVGIVGGDFGRETMSENDGGVAGVVVKGGGGAFVVEFKMARIDDVAFFSVVFRVVADSRGAEVRPRPRVADRERERDRVPTTMLPKSMGYTP